MKNNIFDYFSIQRNIFGLCPRSGELFRLSDCKVFLRKKPVRDWMDQISSESKRIDRLEEKLDEREHVLREKARAKGRRLASIAVRKIDPIFTPRRLNPDDAKVLLHPVDYIVFCGMKSRGSITQIILLDRKDKNAEHRPLQRSIEKTVDQGRYEWRTIRVREDGTMKEES